MRNRKRLSNNPTIWKTLKDYSIPLIIVWIVLLLIINFVFSSWKEDKSTENKDGLSIALDTVDTEAYVQYPWDYKKKIEAGLSLYKWEKIIVKTWTVTIQWKNIGEYKINKLWEVKYNEDGSLALFSSDLWVKNKTPITVNMRFAKLNIWENSVLNLTQNDVLSTIYLLNGFVEVSNLAGKNTVLAPWQKVMIARADAAKEEIDISLQKEDLDDYFKASDWFVKNNGEIYLKKEDSTGTGSTGTGGSLIWSIQGEGNTLIHFTNLQDEQTISEKAMTVNGTFEDEEINSIKLWSLDAKINQEEKTFSFSNISFDKKINDLVFKVYNSDEEVIGKYIFTIYSTIAQDESTSDSSSNTDENNPFDVKNYSLDDTNFKFISPKQNPYTSSDDVVMIEWLVPARTVSKIEVNGFALTKFPQNGTYWKYYANKDFWNLKEWLNVYEIKYLDASWKVIYKNAFSIIKEVSSSANSGASTY